MRRKCCLLLLVCLVSASGFSQSNFDHRQFAGPANATLRSQVDLNKDGIPDLLLGLNGGIVVVLSNGNGTWQTPRQYPIGASSSTAEFAVEDFNRDGNPDVIFTNRENAYLLLGNGDGTLRAPTVIPNTQNATRSGWQGGSCYRNGLRTAGRGRHSDREPDAGQWRRNLRRTKTALSRHS